MRERYFTEVCRTCGGRFSKSIIDAHEAGHANIDERPPGIPVEEFLAGLFRISRASAHTSVSELALELGRGEKPPADLGEGPRLSLEEAVAADLAALTDGLPFAGRAELPAPPRDLTGYADAFASATKNCRHDDAVMVLLYREWRCDDCHRVLDREAMQRAGRTRK